jgi:spermidine synthase
MLAASQFTENLHGEDAFQGFAVEEVIYSGKTPFQQIDIYQTRRFGRVLVLDGIVQTTELDEFMYHEMLVHVPMFATGVAKEVLIVGGGDGGSLREVLKHDIERVDMVEIDRQVVDRTIEYLPTLNHGGAIYRDPRANLIVADAFEYLRDSGNTYDVIISDSTDPIGAGEVLFSVEFYELCKNALNRGGAMSLQDGVVFLQSEEPRESMRLLRGVGLLASCYLVAVPTYYGGAMTLGFATDSAPVLNANLATLAARFDRADVATRHYTPEHHLASFVLPKWVTEIVEGPL